MNNPKLHPAEREFRKSHEPRARERRAVVGPDSSWHSVLTHGSFTDRSNLAKVDHGKLKQLSRPVRGFKTLNTAYATIVGFEVMRALRKAQATIFNPMRDIRGEAHIVERAFGLGPSTLAETISLIGQTLNLHKA